MVSVSDDVLTRLPAALEQPSKGPYTSAMLPVAVRRGGGPARDLARYNSKGTPSVRLVLGLIAFLLIETTPVGGQSRGRQAEQFDRITEDKRRDTRHDEASQARTPPTPPTD